MAASGCTGRPRSSRSSPTLRIRSRRAWLRLIEYKHQWLIDSDITWAYVTQVKTKQKTCASYRPKASDESRIAKMTQCPIVHTLRKFHLGSGISVTTGAVTRDMSVETCLLLAKVETAELEILTLPDRMCSTRASAVEGSHAKYGQSQSSCSTWHPARNHETSVRHLHKCSCALVVSL